MKKSLSLLIALVLALALGITASVTQQPLLLNITKWVEPIGTIWIGFLKMTMLPLIISLLIISVGSRNKQSAPFLKKTLTVFLTLYVLLLLIAMLLVPFFLQTFLPDVPILEGITENSDIANGKPLSFIDQIIGWVPENPFKSASDGAILPLVIFSILFGLAINHIGEDQKAAITNFFKAVSEAMLKIVDWVLYIAPIGIFCVVFPLASRMGGSLAGALGVYVLIWIIMSIICIIILYIITSVYTKIPINKLIQGFAKPQFVALGTQSSLATLPVMVEAAENKLGIQPRVVNIVLPLSVAVFRAGTTAIGVIYALFTAHILHIDLSFFQLLMIFLISLTNGVGGVGLPSGATFFAPTITLFMAAGLPIEMLPILFAVDTIPDMVVTATNVTADMSAVCIVAENEKNILNSDATPDKNESVVL